MIRFSEKVHPEYIALVADILEDPDFQSLEQYKQHVNSNRLQHSINVSYLAWWLARKYGADERQAARAGLLHDFCMYDFHEQRSEGQESEVYRHPKVAAANARAYFHVSDREYEAILSHMYPLGPKPSSDIGWIVTYADKISALSEFVHIRVGLSRKGRVSYGLATS